MHVKDDALGGQPNGDFLFCGIFFSADKGGMDKCQTVSAAEEKSGSCHVMYLCGNGRFFTPRPTVLHHSSLLLE